MVHNLRIEEREVLVKGVPVLEITQRPRSEARRAEVVKSRS